MATDDHRRRRLPTINVEMIPSKITFFLTDGYFGAIMPYLNVFYKSVGLSTTQAGLISGISLAVSSCFNPLWSSLADATGYRRLIFIILCLGTGSMVFSMPWVEEAVGENETNVICTNSTTNGTSPTISTVNGSSTICRETSRLLNPHTLFYTMLGINTVAWTFFTSLRCFVDGTVTNLVKVKNEEYGTQRLFGCIGYATFTLIAGVIADHYHPKGMSHYTAVFFVFLPCVVFLMPSGLVMLNQAKWDDDDDVGSDNQETVKVSTQLKRLIKKMDVIVFLISVVVSGLALNVFNCFFFVLMEHDMHASKSLMSFALVIGIVCEIGVYAVASKIIKFVGGTVPAFTIGIFSWFPRLMLLSYIVNPWYSLATQPLHCLSMGLTWAAFVDHTYSIVPKKFKVTAIAIVSSINVIGTSAIANMAGGVVWDVYGGRVFFRYTGIMAGVWSVFLTLYFGIKRQLAKNSVATNSNYPEGISHDVELDIDAGQPHHSNSYSKM